MSVLCSYLISHPRARWHSRLQSWTIQIFRGKVYLALWSYKHFIYLFVFLLKLMFCWTIHMFGRGHKQGARDVVSPGKGRLVFFCCGCCHNLWSPLTGCRHRFLFVNRSMRQTDLLLAALNSREARSAAPWLTTRCQAKLKLGFLPAVVCLHV